MAHFEAEFPRKISFGMSGGPSFSTTVNMGFSGFEQRNKNWAKFRSKWSGAIKMQQSADTDIVTDLDLAKNFLINVSGQGDVFRFYDHTDNSVTAGVIGTGDGVNKSFQLSKIYRAAGALGRSYTYTVSKPICTTQITLASVATGTGVYTGNVYGGDNNAYAGRYFTVTGFVTHTTNNGTFLCTASDATHLTLANSASNSESHAATAKSYVLDYLGNNMANTLTVYNNGSAVSATGYVADLATGIITFGTAPVAGHIITADFQFHWPVRFNSDEWKATTSESRVKEGKAISVANIELYEVRLA
jgi:uncharacterized protein (TIGR02217 family)